MSHARVKSRSKIQNSKSLAILNLLRRYESRNITFIDPDGLWPIVWQRARGVHVWDAEGKRYLDLTAAFGVAAAGHANPSVVRAGQRQLAQLPHAMGDVHPHALKARLARELSRLTFERWTEKATRAAGKTIFCNSGFEAVEAALKTAMLATRKPGVIAFAGAYHGLGYGALTATHRDHFRSGFRKQLAGFIHFVPFPSDGSVQPQPPRRRCCAHSNAGLSLVEQALHSVLKNHKIGAILVEPIQVRAGINVPPRWFLPFLRALCYRYHILLIVDEIYTGFGRTGKWFACEHGGVIPDMICLGKALAGGFPLSACVGRTDLMDIAWPVSTGEAIHTSTFLGNPLGCAMALAQLAELERRQLVRHSSELGRFLVGALASLKPVASGLKFAARGLGLLAGIELRKPDGAPATEAAMRIIKSLLHRGFIVLPEGEHSNVISLSPPLTISKPQLQTVVDALEQELTTS